MEIRRSPRDSPAAPFTQPPYEELFAKFIQNLPQKDISSKSKGGVPTLPNHEALNTFLSKEVEPKQMSKEELTWSLSSLLATYSSGNTPNVHHCLTTLLDLTMLMVERGILVINSACDLLCRLSLAKTTDELNVVFNYCESRMDFIVKRIASKKSHVWLKVFNDILRRLSPIHDDKLCGSTLDLMARVVGLGNGSGVNMMGRYNTDNKTITDMGVNLEQEEMEEGVDMELWQNLWRLQHAFCEPPMLKEDKHWETFKTCLAFVIKAFAAHEIPKRDAEAHYENQCNNTGEYFPKYLTSSRLFKYQKRDPSFRRHVLAQAAIVLHNLIYATKLQLDLKDQRRRRMRGLGADDMAWAMKTYDKVMALAKKSPPNDKFADLLTTVLRRENHWVHWKYKLVSKELYGRSRCPPISRDAVSLEDIPTKSKNVDTFKPTNKEFGKQSAMGCETLQALWEEIPTPEIAKQLRSSTGADIEDPTKGATCEALQSTDRNFHKNATVQRRMQRMISEETFCDSEADKSRNDDKFTFSTLRILRRTDHTSFEEAKWKGDRKNFLWHVMKYKVPEKVKPFADLEEEAEVIMLTDEDPPAPTPKSGKRKRVEEQSSVKSERKKRSKVTPEMNNKLRQRQQRFKKASDTHV